MLCAPVEDLRRDSRALKIYKPILLLFANATSISQEIHSYASIMCVFKVYKLCAPSFSLCWLFVYGSFAESMCVKKCCARRLIFQLLQTHTLTHYTFFGNLVGMPTANCLASTRKACKNVMKNCAAFTSFILFCGGFIRMGLDRSK
jgi:hypothetical protein